MMYYKVDIKDLDAQSFQILLRNGNRTTKEFVIFMTLAQKIDLDWSLLLQQPVFLMVANLRVWTTLFSYSSDFEEDEADILDMEPVVAEMLPTFATHQACNTRRIGRSWPASGRRSLWFEIKCFPSITNIIITMVFVISSRAFTQRW